eukprot:TRINITY_DN9572_c0_g1_i1.p1 TRINITY_DN9572_c0_g1~~TRINITY_DN9572_c0_g1_i1.p1  ORF type:complete len:102 (+),score=28.40 TRINITY_DN9572_c0_g1_i1:101-406(+)
MIDPSGTSWGYYACAVGKGSRAAKTELEKLDLANMTANDAVLEAARIIYKVHDDVKDKYFELEMSWISPKSKNLHEFVPEELKKNAEALAKAALDEDEMGM